MGRLENWDLLDPKDHQANQVDATTVVVTNKSQLLQAHTVSRQAPLALKALQVKVLLQVLLLRLHLFKGSQPLTPQLSIQVV